MTAVFKGNDGEVLRFMEEPSRNNFQSEKFGRAIFDTVLSVEIITPGSAESMPVFELERIYCPEYGLDDDGNRLVQRNERYFRYETQVSQYRNGSPSITDGGMPIETWAQVDAGTAATLKASGVFTVEMLANVSDGNLGNLGMGGRTLREQARNFLVSRTFGAPSAAMSSEVVSLRAEVERLGAENAQLKAIASAKAAEPAPIFDVAAALNPTPEPQEPLAAPFDPAAPADPFALAPAAAPVAPAAPAKPAKAPKAPNTI